MKKYLLLSLLFLSACGEFQNHYVPCKAHEIKEGITEEELIKLCGKPYHLNSNTDSKQYAYWGKQRLFVYVKNNKVDFKQWSE